MPRILVPVDFSETAQNALVYAFRVAEAIDADILMYHVYNPASLETQSTPIWMPESMQTGRKTLEQRLENERLLAVEKTGLKDLSCKEIVRAGFMVEATIELARENTPDMIIMGTKGAKNFKAIFSGSNTSKIIAELNVPVFAIPDGTEYREIEKIAYATDLKPGDNKALDKLLNFAGWFNAEIHTFHVCNKDEARCKERLNKLEKRFSDLAADHFIFFQTIKGRNVIESMNRYINDNGMDLLAMLTQKRTFLERIFGRSSHTRKMAFNCKVPLLAYHT